MACKLLCTAKLLSILSGIPEQKPTGIGAVADFMQLIVPQGVANIVLRVGKKSIERLPINSSDGGHVIGTFHPPLNFEAIYACFEQIRQVSQ